MATINFIQFDSILKLLGSGNEIVTPTQSNLIAIS